MASPLTVITGASSGIGLAAARSFAAAGHPVLLLARHVTVPVPLSGAPTQCAEVDVSDYDALQRAISSAEATYGSVGCLINNAGIIDARPFEQVEPESYRREVETNLLGVLNGTKAVLAGMIARQAGTIINISSISDRKTCPQAVAYTATKYAVRAISESLREAEGKHGIRVINIAPAYVKTNIHQDMGITFEEYRQALGNPDFMTAEELAEIILYCYQLPPHLCIRDIVVAPTRTGF
jgi:NADP-dependent 3-hydroxy acid dehydrogenase YdfG